MNLLVINGTSVMVAVVRETDKAVQVRNDSGSPDNHGRTCWLPKSALRPEARYSYGDNITAFEVAPWFARRLDRAQRFALNLAC